MLFDITIPFKKILSFKLMTLGAIPGLNPNYNYMLINFNASVYVDQASLNTYVHMLLLEIACWHEFRLQLT